MAAPQKRMSGFTGPTVRRRVLAARLQELRHGAGLTLEDVARELLVSPTKISRLENDGRTPQLRDIRDLAELYRLGEPETAELMELAEEGRQRGWWQAYDALSSPEKTYLGLETEARLVRAVDLLQIHGLLQTPAYTRALLKHLGPWTSEWPAHRFDQIAESRAIRQNRLTKEPADLEIEMVIGEAALVTTIGSARLMHDQVKHLLDLALLPNVSLQLLPFSAGATLAHAGSFGILDFGTPQMSEAVYLEGLAGQMILDKRRDVDRYQESFTDVSTRALTPHASREYLEKLRTDWHSAQLSSATTGS